jgi:hypothetical protein
MKKIDFWILGAVLIGCASAVAMITLIYKLLR